MATDLYSDFKAYLKKKGWEHLGRKSLAKKLKINESVVARALKRQPIQDRSKFLLWKATGKQIDSLKPANLHPLLQWIYENNYTAESLSKATGIKSGTLGGYLYEGATASGENAAKLYELTKLECFASEEDAVEGTRRIIQQESSAQTAQGQEETLIGSFLAPFESTKYLNSLFAELAEVLTISTVFSVLMHRLELLKYLSPEERQKLIQQIGPRRFGYWVGFLAVLSDEKQLEIWTRLTDHSLKEEEV